MGFRLAGEGSEARKVAINLRSWWDPKTGLLQGTAAGVSEKDRGMGEGGRLPSAECELFNSGAIPREETT